MGLVSSEFRLSLLFTKSTSILGLSKKKLCNAINLPIIGLVIAETGKSIFYIFVFLADR